MSSQIETAAAGLATLASAILGSKAFSWLGNAANGDMPDWMKWLLGPLGALVGMILAIWWLSNRLNKAEVKADKREDERDADRKLLISTLAENTSVMRDVRQVIEKHNKP